MLENMRNVRKAKGLTMKELGDMVGVAEVTISAYENGRREPSLDVLCQIADILDCSLDMLVRGKEKNRPEGRSIDDMVKIFKNLSPQELDMIVSLGAFLQYRKESPEQSGRDSTGNV